MSSSKHNFTRRDFLKIGSASAVGLLLAACGPKDILTSTPGIFPTPGSNILQPKVIASSGGVLDTALVVKIKEHVLPGKSVVLKLRTYGSPKPGVKSPDPDNDGNWDWAFPGPTFRIQPGDQVKIKLYNRLPIQENLDCNPVNYPESATAQPIPTPVFPDCFHANNVTNLHFHGFHVDQGERCDGKFGDDVYLALYPKGQEHVHDQAGIHNRIGEADFEFDVPKDAQPRGSYWYHPHNHGSTDLQVTNGLAGMFIVEDTLNDLFGETKPTEYVLVIQDIAESVNFVNDGNRPTSLINGQVTPNIPMKAGEVQRWRLLNATGKGSNVYNINFDGPEDEKPEIYLISADGIFLDTEQWDEEKPVTSIYMAPGNRVDFLVKARKEGNFSLNANSVQTKKPGNGNGGGKNQATPTAAPADTPATVPLISTTVSGVQTPAMELPDKLPERIHDLRPIADSEIVKYDTVLFSVVDGKGPGQAPVFQIDEMSFDPNYIGHKMVVDTAEEWTITNTTSVAHPFHIHLNPFFIKEFDDPNKGLPDPGRRWQDTIIIPPALLDANGNVVLENGKAKQPGQVVIRHRFPGIVDKFVIHCHILGHEDRGMMQAVAVVNKDGSINECDK